MNVHTHTHKYTQQLTFNDESLHLLWAQLEFLHQQVKGHLGLTLGHLNECQQAHLPHICLMVQSCRENGNKNNLISLYLYHGPYKQFLMYLFLRGICSLKIHLNLLKLLLYLSHYLISSKSEAADEIMAKVQHQFQEIKMDFNSRNSSKRYRIRNLC